MPKLNFDGYLIPEFLLPPKPNQSCMLHYIQRLHSGCPAQKNKCFALLVSPERCWRLGPVATTLCCRQPGPRQLIVKSFRPVSWAQLSQPAHMTGQCWRCCSLGFPPHVAPRSPQVTDTPGTGIYTADVKEKYSRNRYLHSRYEGKFGPKSRSKPLALHPQSS